MNRQYHLAQLNVARMKFPIDDPRFKGFVDALDPVNAAADNAPGFVWRLQTESGDATGVRVLDDDKLLVNMSVWESLESLKAFFMSGLHKEIMRRRREWFEQIEVAYAVLWWVNAGHIPEVGEAEAKLLRLREAGPTADAFTFARYFPPPDERGESE